MQTNYNIFRSVFAKRVDTPTLNFENFDLISKLPNAPYYNEYNFIPTIHKTSDTLKKDYILIKK